MYKNKRKSIVSFVIVLIVLIAVIVCCLLYRNNFRGNGKDSDVIILEKDSYLNDFEVIDDTVHIYCVVSLENESGTGKEVKLTGKFKKEAENGLLKESTLEAHFVDDDTDTIAVAGNSELKYVNIEFIGEFAGNSQMSSRSLPEIDVVNVTD